MDLSKLTDEQLQAMYSKTAATTSSPTELSRLSDDELRSAYLKSRNNSGSLLQDWGTDLKENVQGIVNAVTSPIETAKGLYGIGEGLVSKLKTPGTILLNNMTKSPEIAALDNDIERQKAGFRERGADAVGQMLTDDLSDPLHTLKHRPFTAANYVSTIASGGTLLPGRVGAAAGTISNATNLPGLALRGVARGLAPLQDYARTAGQVDHAGVRTRQALSREFEVPLTRGQIADDASILSREDNLRYAREGQAQTVMRGFDATQDEQIAAATSRLREGMSGRQNAMTPDEIGDVLGTTYQTERQAARNRVSTLYDRAFNLDHLAAAGARSDVPIESVYGLRNALETAFIHSDRPMVPTPELTPATFRAIQMINEFSETGGIRSSFPRATMPPQGAATGQPLVTGISWNQMDTLRKHLNGLRSQARTNPADLAGMRRVLDVFDDSMGQLNPLLNEARSAHSMRVQRFDPQRTNAAGVNTFLGTIANESNPGKLIFDKLFNSNAIRNGTAGPMLQQLSDIAGHNPQAMAAVREGMLNRLMTNLKTGEAYSPKISANNIRDALGGQSSNAYRMVFGPDELAQLGRYQELLDQIGMTRTARNPSKTSYNVNPMLKSMRGAVLGDAIGHGAGAATGIPMAGPIGGAIGAGIGSGLDGLLGNVRDHRAALRAVSGDYTAPSTPPRIANGLAGTIGGIQTGVRKFNGALAPGVLSLMLLEQERKNKR